MWGNNPKLLLNIINMNKAKKITIKWCTFVGRRIETSLFKYLISAPHAESTRELKRKKEGGRIASPIKIELQLRLMFIVEAGSKIENKFAIIVKLSPVVCFVGWGRRFRLLL